MKQYARGEHRTAGWITGDVGYALHCPNGHRILASWMVVSEQVVHCTHRSHRHAEKCTAMLWVIVMRQGLVFAAEVTVDDVRAIKAHRSIPETFAYLGAALPLYPAAHTIGDAA